MQPEDSTPLMKDQLKVLSIAEGFFQSSILFALLKLKIFELIGDGEKTLDELASHLRAEPETLSRLLNGGVVLKLLQTTDGVSYSVERACQSSLLPSAGDNYLGDWIRNLDYCRLALSGLDEAVISGLPTVDPSRHLGDDQQQTREFALGMHNYAALRGKELADYLDTSSSKTLLDLGCGPGTYAFQLASRNPDLQVYLLDLPDILNVAREVQARYPIENQVHYLPLDALASEIPGSYDVVLISNILHMLGEDASRALIRRVYRSVNHGGSLIVQAQYMKDNRQGGRWPVFLDLVQMCTTSKGRNHSVAETMQWLRDAGFTSVDSCSMSVYNTNSFVRGFKA
jgi:SAM-dependent methyltransferase